MSRPSGLIANKGLELLTMQTPNGHKVSIMLEELKEAYGKPEYVYQKIDIMENIQKEPWFTKHGPNGRIPVLIDHDKGISIMEGAAILSYLARNFDPEHKLSFASDPDLSYCEQWVAWQHGGLGPMSGQANHFNRSAKERIAYPTQRYIGETERLYGVLNTQLEGKDYLVANKYSIADIACFSWVTVAFYSGVDLDAPQFSNLKRWWWNISERPAVKRGRTIPTTSKIGIESYQEQLKTDEEFRKKHEELKEFADKAKEQYGYKYAKV